MGSWVWCLLYFLINGLSHIFPPNWDGFIIINHHYYCYYYKSNIWTIWSLGKDGSNWNSQVQLRGVQLGTTTLENCQCILKLLYDANYVKFKRNKTLAVEEIMAAVILGTKGLVTERMYKLLGCRSCPVFNLCTDYSSGLALQNSLSCKFMICALFSMCVICQ